MGVYRPYRKQRGDVWDFTFKNARFLPKPVYMTFASEEEGDAYAARLEKSWKLGLTHPDHAPPQVIQSIEQLARVYLRDASINRRDQIVLGTICNEVGGTPLAKITSQWVDSWISGMKREGKLAPSTIRSKVGSLARCCDWGIRKKYMDAGDRPLRNLPNGYANYTKLDESLAGVRREDVERDRRLERGEYERILAVIESGVLPRKFRPLVLEPKDAFRCLFILAVETAMRLREMFTLTVDQVDLAQRTIFLERTKNGQKRQVPLSSVAVSLLKGYLPERGQVFPWWDGSMSARKLDATSDYLSKLFISIFEVAGCADLKMHDLRHEAICRLYEKTTLTDLQISKISGHRSLTMLRRYSNLRGSSLADRMW